VTYQLFLWDGRGVSTNVYDIDARLLYFSPTLQADDQLYDVPNQHIAFVLKRDINSGQPYKLFYSIDWTGDPGSFTTPGFIKIEGVGIQI
jgi:hypothetical protein